MNRPEIIRKFQSRLPAVRKWIEELLEVYNSKSNVVSSLGFSRLSKYFPSELLDRVKVVTVSKVPFPPLSQLGLIELSSMEGMLLTGITYMDTIFVHHLQRTEELHFHEFVHVVQWERLGIDNFLLTYGIGLVQFGYEQSPLEQMAYNMQHGFEGGILPSNLIKVIQQKTDLIWQQVAPLIQR
jgi:hypothetical protein